VSNRIRLDAGDYWKLRALLRDVHALRLEAQSLATRLADAETKARGCLDDLGKAHGFDTNYRTFTWHDDTCELDATEPGSALH